MEDVLPRVFDAALAHAATKKRGEITVDDIKFVQRTLIKTGKKDE